MRILAIFTIALALVLSAFIPQEVKAERATPQEMELVCQNWLAYMVYQQGGWGGDSHPTIVGVSELAEGDTVLARCFAIAPRGYVAVPILKELPPIQAYSEEYGLEVTATVGVPQLIREILLDRVRRFVRVYGSLDASQPSRGTVLLGRVHRQEWERFSSSDERFEADLRGGAFRPLRDAGPLMTTSWFQGAPYSNLCPMGDGGRCAVGCVAIAAAQIMKYHNWPPIGIGDTAYFWDGDQSCGGNAGGGNLYADFSDAYDWENMPDSCDFGCSPEDSAALAELCYEVGVAFEMDYGVCGSGTWPFAHALVAFPTFFRYADSVDSLNRADSTADAWFNSIRAEVNANRPMMYYFGNSEDWAHEIVCDGWRIAESMNQYHMNYGWGGPHTDWYTIDDLYGSDYPTTPEYLIRGISPAGFSGTLGGTLGPGTFHIVGDISINSGESLRLMPGTTFIFDGPYPFRLYGTLLAEGTESDSIVFTTEQSGDNRWRGLRFEGTESSGSRLAHCLIEKGYAYGSYPENYGGGVHCSYCSPAFTNCSIRDNLASHGGGGVSCDWYCSPTFTNCTISGNSANHYGGVSCGHYCSPAFTNCTISGNSVSGNAGGIYCEYSSASFTNCTLSANSAGSGGGVYCAYSPSPTFTNCIFSGNLAQAGGGASCYLTSPTFMNCHFNNNWAHDGGGVICDNASPAFGNCTIAGNWANYGLGGGALLLEASSPTFTNCTISGNSAAGGGGVWCEYSSAILISCTIDSNSATESGGGVMDFGSISSSFANCTISGNSANLYGGGVLCMSSSAVLTNCTICGNSAGIEGGGVVCWGSSATLNSTLVAFSIGSGIHFRYGSESQVRYCDIFGNSVGNVTFYNNDPAHGPPGIGLLVTANANGDSCDIYRNIFLDPLFADTTARDFHLTDSSPCIGAGNPADTVSTDFEGDPRPNPLGSYSDIGTDEHPFPGSAFHVVVLIESGNAVLRWWSPYGAGPYNIYGATSPFVPGILLDTVTGTTTWTDNETSSRPSPYFYYVTVVE